MKKFNTPILFLVFNRPEETKQVFDAIRTIQPKQLFIAADGPRNNNKEDEEKCKQVRTMVSKVDWDCEVKLLFREDNLGSADAVSRAVTWFFTQVEQGIILEDDTVPDLSFFPFCQEMLSKYASNTQIMHISGFNYGIETGGLEHSYFFSAFPASWGWATWRNAWYKFSWRYSLTSASERKKYIGKYLNGYLEKRFFSKCFSRYNWDYQWMNTIMKNEGLVILPKNNLVTNIGFNEKATRTKNENSPMATVKAVGMPTDSLVHPTSIGQNKPLDAKIFQKTFFHQANPLNLSLSRFLSKRKKKINDFNFKLKMEEAD